MLDSEEYLHLAINATQSNDHHSALNYLHKALEIEPTNAKARFLLGAQYAELGLTRRAISELEECLTLDSSVELASIQLAILYIAEARSTEAAQCLNSLIDQTSDKVLITFAEALKCLINEDQVSALELINQTLRLDISNQPLLRTIEKIRDQLTLIDTAPEAPIETQDTRAANSRVGLSSDILRAYEKPSFEDDDE